MTAHAANEMCDSEATLLRFNWIWSKAATDMTIKSMNAHPRMSLMEGRGPEYCFTEAHAIGAGHAHRRNGEERRGWILELYPSIEEHFRVQRRFMRGFGHSRRR